MSHAHPVLDAVQAASAEASRRADSILRHSASLQAAVRNVSLRCSSDDIDSERCVGRLLDAIKAEAVAVLASAEGVREAMAAPLDRFCRGLAITCEDFHLLLANGILVDRKQPTEYDKFMMFHYQDNETRGYIDVNDRPCDPGKKCRASLRLGNEVPPEHVRVSRLKEDQREFFRTKFPGIFTRFRTD